MTTRIIPAAATDPQSEMFNTLFDHLYEQLNKSGLWRDCRTRTMSWDEAAAECRQLVEDTGDSQDRAMYDRAQVLYQQASDLWVAIEDADKLFAVGKGNFPS